MMIETRAMNAQTSAVRDIVAARVPIHVTMTTDMPSATCSLD